MEKSPSLDSLNPDIQHRPSWVKALVACVSLLGVTTLYGQLPNLSYEGFRRQYYHSLVGGTIQCGARSPYGRFPLPDDPFHFIPCTNATLLPALTDSNPVRSWARLFDPKPEHWSWGAPLVAENNAQGEDPYSGRGIYLCGYLDVPLDYTNKTEPRIVRLAVTKYQVSGLARVDTAQQPISPTGRSAGSKSERTIIVNPGGPGASGTLLVWRAGEDFTKRLSDGRFDVLGWDPRGVNASLPSIACFPHDAYRDRWSLLTGQYREAAGPLEVKLELADALNNATFFACKEKYGDTPRFLSTAFVARDMEEIRKALGEDEVTSYLVSYGTSIGQTWANMFPHSVGRVILDGLEYVRDHRRLGGFGWGALDNTTDVWRDGFLGECVNAGPKYCALSQPRGSQPVSLRGLEDRMEKLLVSLGQRPIAGYLESSGPSLVTYSAIVSAIYGALHNANSWPALAQMLYELEMGNSTLAAAFLDRSQWEYDPSLPCLASPRPRSRELFPLVICADSYDSPLPPDGLLWWQSLWANMTARSWISGNEEFLSVLPCQHFRTYWPPPAELYRGDLNNTLKNPLLLIAETHDPATPLRNGKNLLSEMGKNARLIIHHGYGHSSRDKSSCTDSIMKTYILNGTLPTEQETSCYADGKPYLYGPDLTESSSQGAMVQDPIQIWREHIRELRSWNTRLVPR
ncbi:Alpha/Beta hydrolase protein [Daldinia bambusicola]|nr:Alpha/Beta hydrolase protein [Daldinia bambusicola]